MGQVTPLLSFFYFWEHLWVKRSCLTPQNWIQSWANSILIGQFWYITWVYNQLYPMVLKHLEPPVCRNLIEIWPIRWLDKAKIDTGHFHIIRATKTKHRVSGDEVPKKINPFKVVLSPYLYLYLYLSVYLSVYIYIYICTSTYLYVYIHISTYTYISTYLSIYLSIYLCIHRSIHLSIYLSIHRSIHLYIYLSIYLSIHLSIFLSIYLSVYLSYLAI